LILILRGKIIKQSPPRLSNKIQNRKSMEYGLYFTTLRKNFETDLRDVISLQKIGGFSYLI